MTKKQIIIAGVGGQGVVSAGGMLAEAAAIYEKREALMMCAYGSEARGTFTKTEVIIDEKRIFFPEVIAADVVVALHQIAYERYFDALKEDTLLVYDSDCITPKESRAKQLGLPITSVAEESGDVRSVNIAALGMLSAIGDTAGLEPLEKMVRKKFAGKEKVIERNINVLHSGYKLMLSKLN